MGLTAEGALRNFRGGVQALCREARALSPTCRLVVSPMTIIPPDPSATGQTGTTEMSWDYAFIDGDEPFIPAGWDVYGPWPTEPARPAPGLDRR